MNWPIPERSANSSCGPVGAGRNLLTTQPPLRARNVYVTPLGKRLNRKSSRVGSYLGGFVEDCFEGCG